MSHLAKLPKLEKLCLRYNAITDDGLSPLAQITSLKVLELSGTEVTNAGLAHLASLTGLEVLDLLRTKVDDGGVEGAGQVARVVRHVVAALDRPVRVAVPAEVDGDGTEARRESSRDVVPDVPVVREPVYEQ